MEYRVESEGSVVTVCQWDGWVNITAHGVEPDDGAAELTVDDARQFASHILAVCEECQRERSGG